MAKQYSGASALPVSISRQPKYQKPKASAVPTNRPSQYYAKPNISEEVWKTVGPEKEAFLNTNTHDLVGKFFEDNGIPLNDPRALAIAQAQIAQIEAQKKQIVAEHDKVYQEWEKQGERQSKLQDQNTTREEKLAKEDQSGIDKRATIKHQAEIMAREDYQNKLGMLRDVMGSFQGANSPIYKQAVAEGFMSKDGVPIPIREFVNKVSPQYNDELLKRHGYDEFTSNYRDPSIVAREEDYNSRLAKMRGVIMDNANKGNTNFTVNDLSRMASKLFPDETERYSAIKEISPHLQQQMELVGDSRTGVKSIYELMPELSRQWGPENFNRDLMINSKAVDEGIREAQRNRTPTSALPKPDPEIYGTNIALAPQAIGSGIRSGLNTIENTVGEWGNQYVPTPRQAIPSIEIGAEQSALPQYIGQAAQSVADTVGGWWDNMRRITSTYDSPGAF